MTRKGGASATPYLFEDKIETALTTGAIANCGADESHGQRDAVASRQSPGKYEYLPNPKILHVHNHSELHVDEIVVRVREKGGSAHRASPLRGRVGWRHGFRGDVGRRSIRGIIEGREWPLHDERGEPLFPELMVELDSIKSRTLSGLMIRRDRKDRKAGVPLPWITAKGGLDYLRATVMASPEPPRCATISP